MKKTILAASLVALTVLGGCSSIQGFGARFQRNLQWDAVTNGERPWITRRDAEGKNIQRPIVDSPYPSLALPKINLTDPGPHDLAIFGEEASRGQRQWPNYNTASGWALFMRLSKVLGGLLRAKEGARVPYSTAQIKYCVISSLANVTCFFNAGGDSPASDSANGAILYADGHIDLILHPLYERGLYATTRPIQIY